MCDKFFYQKGSEVVTAPNNQKPPSIAWQFFTCHGKYLQATIKFWQDKKVTITFHKLWQH